MVGSAYTGEQDYYTIGGNTHCIECDKRLEGQRRKYCSDKCSNRVQMRRYRARKRGEEVLDDTAQKTDSGEALRGGVYEEIKRRGLVDALINDDYEFTQRQAAELIGCDQSAVAKSVRALREDKKLRQAEEDFEAPSIPELTLENLDALVQHFMDFRAANFITPRVGVDKYSEVPYPTPPHQKRWLRAIIRTIINGGKLMILSPPRHGKTELVAHIQCWLICCVSINIRILNVGGNEDISSNSSGMTKQMLEENENLLQYIPDGQVYRPKRTSGHSWTDSKFTVAPRTNPALKSPTMVAVGRGGGIDSRDADFIVVDDLEDHNSTWTETNRGKTRQWWEITVMSRKEAHTAQIVIGSRHHPDDLYHHIQEDPGWECMVETAHDEAACTVEIPDGMDLWSCNCDITNIRDSGLQGHEEDCHFRQHTAQHEGGCMLWPDFRDFQWLSEKRGPNFEMVWLNNPVDKGTSIFTRELIDGCKDHRKTGQEPNIEDGYGRLIAGLDPSGTQHQAVFLWAFNPKTEERFAVDFENEKGGGIRKARKQIQHWYEKYGVRWWVIEKDLYHGGIIDDELLKMYRQKHSIHLEPHETGLNKWDPELGVSAIADWMDRGKVHIPWGDHLTAQKWKDYRRQLINFSRERRRNRKSDIVMASWFPEWRMQQWRKDWMADGNMRRSAPGSNYPFEPMSDIYERVYA